MLRRLDLSCKTVAPFLVGLLMQYSELASAIFLMGWNFFSAFGEYAVLKSIYNQGIPALTAAKEPGIAGGEISILDIDALKKYWRTFFLPGLAFGLLYLSVLGFDSSTVGFITSQGVEEGLIGVVSLFAAVFGVIGTVIFQWSAKRFGLRQTGLVGYAIDLVALSLCFVLVFTPNLIEFNWSVMSLPVLLFLIGISVSRVGLWMTDLAVNQLIQTETANPSLIGGIQTSVNILAELIKFIIVALIPALSDFWILILISYGSIALGGILFAIYSHRSAVKSGDSESKSIVNEKILYGSFDQIKS